MHPTLDLFNRWGWGFDNCDTMLLILYTCLFWLTISGLQPVQAQKNTYLQLAPRNIDFAFNLFQHLADLAPNDNVIFSPISISIALSMISLVADDRMTGKQILQGLGFDTHEIPEEKIYQGFQHLYQYFKDLEMLMGNTLFFKHKVKLKASSSNFLTKYYGLENVVLDSKDWDRASNQINDYIANKTHGEISDLFSDQNDPSILTLINYIFFIGLWKKPFNPEEIREGNFYGKHLKVLKVPLMYQVNDFKLLHDPLLSCTVLQMDYLGHSTFYFILADLEDLDKVIQALSQDALQRWSMSGTNRHLGIYIPKFSLSGTYDLMAIMKSMGITNLKKGKPGWPHWQRKEEIVNGGGRVKRASTSIPMLTENAPGNSDDAPSDSQNCCHFGQENKSFGGRNKSKEMRGWDLALKFGGKRKSLCCGLRGDLMIGLGLLLSCLWAQAQLVADSPLITTTPEAFEEAMTLLTYTGQDQAYEDMQDTLNQTSNDVNDNGAWPKEEDSEEESWLTGRAQLSEGISNLGFSLLRRISMKHDSNVVFSPLSVAFALAALTLGSKGQTKAELERGLGLQNLNRTRHLPQLFRQLRDTLSFNQELGLTQGSFAFIHKDFNARETFLNLSSTYLDTQCVPVNFHNAPQARILMNYYINKETRGRIPQFFDEVNPSTKFILADYILLRGKWLSPFDPTATEVDMFYLDKYQAVKVPMMFQAGKFASTFDKTFRCHVLQLPYQGNASMLVILMENMGDHLALEDYLTAELVDKWLRTMKTREMEIYFPKFKLDREYGLHKLLTQLGIREIFSTRANLSEISATARDLRVSKVLQRTVFEVDEKGTDAVAGTQSQITAYSMPSIIKLNRPFHFLIYEETSRMPLFLGRVMNPNSP